MIPQLYPLYTSRAGQDFLVVGWVASGGEAMYPVLAPLDLTGRASICRGQDLIFRTEREIYPAPSVPDPSDAVTERIRAPFYDSTINY